MHTKFHLHACYTEHVMRREEVILKKFAWSYFVLVVVMETIEYTHAYQVSPPCVCYTEQVMRSEEVILKKIAWGYFLLVVVMETIEYTCVPSFTSMRAILSKL